MIRVAADRAFAALAARLTARAEAIGRGRGDRRRPRSGEGPERWRRAEYLWPGFAKG